MQTYVQQGILDHRRALTKIWPHGVASILHSRPLYDAVLRYVNTSFRFKFPEITPTLQQISATYKVRRVSMLLLTL